MQLRLFRAAFPRGRCRLIFPSLSDSRGMDPTPRCTARPGGGAARGTAPPGPPPVPGVLLPPPRPRLPPRHHHRRRRSRACPGAPPSPRPPPPLPSSPSRSPAREREPPQRPSALPPLPVWYLSGPRGPRHRSSVVKGCKFGWSPSSSLHATQPPQLLLQLPCPLFLKSCPQGLGTKKSTSRSMT